jgi:NDP-sugar pyrophosphorylase family protein
MFQAFVLAAGLGTRLRPLTLAAPKPLVPVCGVPLLAYSLATCAKHGLVDVVVNAHWLAEQVEAWAGEREGCRVTVVTEVPEILGTGGGLRNVADRLAPRFAVLNADVLHDVDLTALLAAVPEGGAAMALREDRAAPGYGIVAADAEDRIVELAAVASGPAVGPVERTTHFTGIHAMDRSALARIPPGFQCVVRTAYRELVPERKVAGIRYPGPWLDAGDPAAYVDANLVLLRGEASFALDPFARAGWARSADGREHGDRALVAGVDVDGPAWVGAGARLPRGTRLSHAIVGAGAELASGAELSECVVWDGARAGGHHRRSVLWASEVLRCSG